MSQNHQVSDDWRQSLVSSASRNLWLSRHTEGRSWEREKFLNQDAVAPIDFTRAASRETLRDIVFLWTTPF